MKFSMVLLLFFAASCRTNILHEIQNKIQGFNQRQTLLPYEIRKIDTIIIEDSYNRTMSFGSSTIVNSNRVSYPVMICDSQKYYTIEGQMIISKDKNRCSFLKSSTTNQFMYFASIENRENQKESKVGIYKLVDDENKGKKNIFWKEKEIEFDEESNGKIINYIQTYTKSQKISGFATNKGLFYLYRFKEDKIIQSHQIPHYKANDPIYLIKVHFKILIYTSWYFTIISPLGEEENKCLIPILKQNELIQQIAYDDENMQYFYVKTNSHIYIYERSELECKPVKKYWIPFKDFKIWIMKSLIVIESDQKYVYYNINDEKLNYFDLPEHDCQKRRRIQIHKKGRSQYILCRFCQLQYSTKVQSFLLNFKNLQKSSYDETYQKMRIPMIIICFIIIIYMTTKKNKSRLQQIDLATSKLKNRNKQREYKNQ